MIKIILSLHGMVSRIFELANRRFLDELQAKWWNRDERNMKCKEYDEIADEIAVDNIGGLFILILIGIFISLGVIVVEYLWFKYYIKPKMACVALLNRQRIQQYILLHSKYRESLRKAQRMRARK